MSNELFDAIDARDSELALEILGRQPQLVGTRDEAGLTPLMQAVYRRMNGVVAGIRSVHADLDVFEAAALGDMDRLARLTEGGAQVNSWSADGFTPLHLACFFNQVAAVRLLLDRGAAVDVPAMNERFAVGAHPLHSAVAAGAREIAVLLVGAGADPNAKQHGGYTPLTEAAQNGDTEMVKVLLEHSADPSVPLADGTSAAELARRAGQDALADRLEAAARAASLPARDPGPSRIR